MSVSHHFPRFRTILPASLLAGFVALPAKAHEAWLLTPAEIEALAAEPVPHLFTSQLWLGIAALIGGVVTVAALRAEDVLRVHEERLCQPLAARAAEIGPLVLRLGLAVMLVLAATGGLPRHGTAMWAEPTLLVPDMQLGLIAGWDWLIAVQLGIAILLMLGLFTRAASIGLIALALLGPILFGSTFLSYTPHFAAPGLMLALAGGGALSLDREFAIADPLVPARALLQPGWRLAQILVGAGFLYLAIAYKLTQPTLLIAILDHGSLPTFGMPNAVIALIMTGIEIICGALLIVGRLTRPVALAIIGAITVLAIGLGETPLFHANLYGVMIFFALSGQTLSEGRAIATRYERIDA